MRDRDVGTRRPGREIFHGPRPETSFPLYQFPLIGSSDRGGPALDRTIAAILGSFRHSVLSSGGRGGKYLSEHRDAVLTGRSPTARQQPRRLPALVPTRPSFFTVWDSP